MVHDRKNEVCLCVWMHQTGTPAWIKPAVGCRPSEGSSVCLSASWMPHEGLKSQTPLQTDIPPWRLRSLQGELQGMMGNNDSVHSQH